MSYLALQLMPYDHLHFVYLRGELHADMLKVITNIGTNS